MEILFLIFGIAVGFMIHQYWFADDRCQFMTEVLKRQDEFEAGQRKFRNEMNAIVTKWSFEIEKKVNHEAFERYVTPNDVFDRR